MSMTLLLVLAVSLALAFGLFTLLWAVSAPVRNIAIVDIFWGPAFVLIAWIAFAIVGAGQSWREWLLAICVTLWGLRLAFHLILRDTSDSPGEHERYMARREALGDDFHRWSLPNIFWLQAGLVWIISLPIQVGIVGSAENPRMMGWIEDTGFAIFIIGFLIETVADYQLARFRADEANRLRVLDTGLWAFSRHPNYFGEAVLWWGLYLMALGATGTWWTIIAPIIVTVRLLHFSGIPPIESRLRATREDYEDYARRTSAFVLWPPRPRNDQQNPPPDHQK